MTRLSSRAKLSNRGQRHPLLFQQRFSEQIFWPSTLTIALCTGLLLWRPARLTLLLPLFYASLGLAAGVLVLAYAFRLRAYVQCRNEGLLLQLPFFRLLIPYEDLVAVRPTEIGRMYPLEKQRWPSRGYLERLATRTVLVIELKSFPRPLSFLRLWMHKYMLCPDRIGFILALRDWMAFRGELDEYRTRSMRL